SRHAPAASRPEATSHNFRRAQALGRLLHLRPRPHRILFRSTPCARSRPSSFHPQPPGFSWPCQNRDFALSHYNLREMKSITPSSPLEYRTARPQGNCKMPSGNCKICDGAIGDLQYQKSPITSPPERVPRARQMSGATLLFTVRTDPSMKSVLTTPG